MHNRLKVPGHLQAAHERRLGRAWQALHNAGFEPSDITALPLLIGATFVFTYENIVIMGSVTGFSSSGDHFVITATDGDSSFVRSSTITFTYNSEGSWDLEYEDRAKQPGTLEILVK